MAQRTSHRAGRMVPVLLGASALPLVGCDQLVGPMTRVCTAIAMPAIAVEVRDASTDAPVGPGARIVASSGRFADTVHVPANSNYQGAYGLASERAGVYTVTVEQQGYQPWSRAGIRVVADECHVKTVSVIARLQR